MSLQNLVNSVITCMSILSITILGSCSPRAYQKQLSSVHIVDHNGFAETITSQERVKRYQSIDFTKPQPYQEVSVKYSKLRNNTIPGIIISYYDNGNVKQCLETINTKASGLYKEWHSNGKRKLESIIINGIADLAPSSQDSWVFDGQCKAWDEKGNKEATILYVSGNLEGISTYYHPNGNIWKVVPYRDNEIDGQVYIYVSTGNLLQSTEYINGKKHGTSLKLWSEKAIAATEKFHEGKLLSGEYTDSNGKAVGKITNGNGNKVLFGKNIISEIHEYRNGKQEGSVSVYSETGGLSQKYHMANGQKHGEETLYYPDGSTHQLSIVWCEGVINGPVTTWYQNGMMESHREVKNNHQQGIASAWYTDGSLMYLEEYNSDKLLRGKYYRKGEDAPVSSVNNGCGIATIYNIDGQEVNSITYKEGAPV